VYWQWGSQAACQAVNIDSAVVLLCVTRLDNRVTEQHASCHAIGFSLFEAEQAPADIILATHPQQV